MYDPTTIRPKLKHNVVILLTDEGVIFQSDEVAFRLKGPSVARWMSVLTPLLTGEYTLEALCDPFAPAQREMVVRLVETLLHKGVLKNMLPEPPGLLPDAVRQHFRPQIECIDRYIDSPPQRFKTFRESHFLLIGSGESLTWLTLSLLCNGLEHVFLAPTDGPGVYVEALTSEVAPAPWVAPKRRGRPRIYPLPDLTMPKRPRGRPRKVA